MARRAPTPAVPPRRPLLPAGRRWAAAVLLLCACADDGPTLQGWMVGGKHPLLPPTELVWHATICIDDDGTGILTVHRGIIEPMTTLLVEVEPKSEDVFWLVRADGAQPEGDMDVLPPDEAWRFIRATDDCSFIETIAVDRATGRPMGAGAWWHGRCDGPCTPD